MNIGIVGGEESKWSLERKKTAQRWILKILEEAKHGRLLLVPSMDHTTWSFREMEPDDVPILVSGRCKRGGIDVWAEQIADELGIRKEIYPAEVEQWLDKTIPYSSQMFGSFMAVRLGYRSRNIRIATVSKVLYDIESAGSCIRCYGTGRRHSYADTDGVVLTSNEPCIFCEGDSAYSGGTWTLKRARERGKETFKIIVGPRIVGP